MCVLKVLEYHAAFASVDSATLDNIDAHVARIIKYAQRQ